MFLQIFLFELRYRLVRPATYIYFLIFFLLCAVLIATGSTPATEKVYHNAPIIIAELLTICSIFGIIITSAVMGVPLYRDIEHKTGNYLFSYPVSKTAYFMGRFWGSFVVVLFIMLGGVAGIYVGSLVGPLFGITPAERFGPQSFVNYFHPFFTVVVPNLWLAATLFFALVIFTRNVKSIYSGSILVFIGYLLANFLARDIENKNLVQLIDPFGMNAIFFETRYFTAFERNNLLVPITGFLLLNRILWAGLGVLFFVAAYLRFDFGYFFNPRGSIKKFIKEPELATAFKLPASRPVFNRLYTRNTLWTLTKIEVQNILKDAYFRAILLGGVVFLVLDFWIGATLYSVPSLPVTMMLMEFKTWDYNIFVFIILVFYTGEALHREKATGFASISDSFPVRNSLFIGSKFLGMLVICFILATFPIVVGVIIQTLKGFFNYRFDIYFIDSYLISFVDYVQMVMLVFAIHLLINSKFAGHAVSALIWLVMIILRNFADMDFNLFFYSYKPGYIWSDMNGLGHFAAPLLWFNLYWLAVGAFLILFFSIFFSRGAETSLKHRLRLARQRLAGTGTFVSYACLLVALGTGAYLFKEVVYTNDYITSKEGEKRQVAYEKQLKKYEFIPQPKVTDVKLFADVFPQEREAKIRSLLTLVNKTDQPIDSLHLTDTDLTAFEVFHQGQKLNYRYPLHLENPRFQLVAQKKQKEKYRIYKLPATLQPGDSLRLEVQSLLKFEGIRNNGYGREILYNGTFFSGGIPSIGYNREGELNSDEKRKKYKLREKLDELPGHQDPFGVKTMLFNDDADLVTFEAVVSTVPSQIAIAPGYLQREWTQNGRRYFHYKQDTPIQLFFNIVSAEYAVLRDKVTLDNGQPVNIEIFYNKAHSRNLDRFLASYKDGLAYFSKTYGPFQFRQMRLMEFPRYAGFAQSFPNTVPFAESFGWIGDFSDPNSFDYVYYVTAHELAHQWWGHQITPNYTRGSNLLSESLAEYTALVLTERKYGKDNMKRFLKEEVDGYLAGRTRENKKENVYINCNRPYQWYQKGSVILYALRDLIGEEAIDKGIRSFRDEYALKESPPFPGSTDLFRHLKANTPDSLQYFLTDTWQKITLYENKAVEAKAKKLAGDEYLVTLKFNSNKLYADSLGQETAAKYQADYIDVGILAAETTDAQGRKKTNPLYMQKHKLPPGVHTLQIKVKGKPVKAGIDPYNKLIDRNPDDNTIAVDA